MPYLKFNEWLPDLEEYQSPGITVAKNVVPLDFNYRCFPSFQVFSAALTARPQGFISAINKAGTVFNFTGDTTKLYELSDASWDDVSRTSGGAYATASDGGWEFTQWENQILACNGVDAMQEFTMGTSTDFAAQTGSPPTAKYITSTDDFVIVGNVLNEPFRVQWSALGDPTSWTASSSTQAGQQDLNAEHGWVTNVVATKYGWVIFQENAISLATYVGSPIIFNIQTVAINVGCASPKSVINTGQFLAFYHERGFYTFDGSNVNSISFNKVNRYFDDDVDKSKLDRIVGVLDPKDPIIYWIYPGVGSTGGRPNRIMIYNYSSQRWSFAEIDLEYIGITLAEGYTLDGLDSVTTDLDALTPSLDSRFWAGGSKDLAGFNSDFKLGTLTGAALDSTIETQEFELNPGFVTQVNRIRPMFNGTNGTLTMQFGTRCKQNEDLTWSVTYSENAQGTITPRSKARYHRVRFNMTGEFESQFGVDLEEAIKGGRR